MDSRRFITQCQVRQCSKCQGNTDFYCFTCKNGLCLQCKEKHFNSLDTINHDVVIYRETKRNILKKEPCVQHPERIYEKFCRSCEFPVCFECKEHKKHQIQDIRAAYITNRQKIREIIHNIRSETLHYSFSLLAKIKTYVKTCHTSNCERETNLSIGARILKIFIVIEIYSRKARCEKYMMDRQLQQTERMNRHLTSIENYEHRSEHSANRPVKFLEFLKKTRVPKMKDTPNLTQHALISLTDNGASNMQDVIQFHVLREIQTIGTVKTQVTNEWLLKLMSTPLVLRYITLKGLRQVTHISQVTSDQVWINDDGNLILTNTEGDTLHQLTDVEKYKCGIHTTTISCDLIYIDDYHNINKLSIDNKTKSILIKRTAPWRRQCVYCSPSNGDLLVASTTPNTAKVTRHDDTGQHIQTIQHFNGQELYGLPAYITENRNGDIIVSDWSRYAIMVTDREGVYRFVYPEPSSSSKVELYGICTDALSNILVSDPSTRAVHMIDKDGQFLSLIQTRKLGIGGAKGLSYDEKKSPSLDWIGVQQQSVCLQIHRQTGLSDRSL